MSEFFKIFESEKYGQILVINNVNEEGNPSVEIKFNRLNGFGICSINAAFAGSSEGFSNAVELFEISTEEQVIEVIAGILDSVKKSRVHH